MKSDDGPSEMVKVVNTRSVRNPKGFPEMEIGPDVTMATRIVPDDDPSTYMEAVTCLNTNK